MGNNPSRNASATTTPRASSSRRLFQGLGVAANQPDPNSSETSAGDRDYSQYASESAAGSGSAAVKLQTPPPLEYVDGGQTHSFGKLYTGIPDYDMVIVKKFILEKRLAPFFSPLDEVAANAKDANSADDKDEESASKTTEEALKIKLEEQDNEKSAGSAGINSDHSDHPSSMECPICFMLYPPYFNYTKCCDQPICTDCFIQIKRPESTFEPAPCPYCQTPNLSIIYQSKDRLAGNTSTFPVIIESVDESDASANVKESPTTSDSKNPSIPSVVSANIDKDQTVQPAQNIQSSSGADGDSAAGFVSTAPTASLSRRQSNHPVLTSDDIRPDWRERKQKIELDRILEQQRIALATARRRQMEAFSQAEIANAALFAAQIYEGSSGSSGGRSNSLLRSFRNGSGRRNEETQAQYVRAMRYLGADVEELMLLEAMRRSMQDSNPQTTTVTAVEASPLPATTTENAPIESQPDNSEPEPS